MTFEEWAGTGQDRLLRFALVLCGGRHLAEDVVQEVLLRGHQRWDGSARWCTPTATCTGWW